MFTCTPVPVMDASARVQAVLASFGVTLTARQVRQVVAAAINDVLNDTATAKVSESPQTLQVYTVTLRRQRPGGPVIDVATTAVMCYSADQATAHAEREFWNPQYDTSGFEPVFEVTANGFAYGFADIDLVAEWLTNTASIPVNGGEPSLGRVWEILVEQGANSVAPDDQADTDQVRLALQAILPKQPSVGHLVHAMYQVLPAGAYLMAATAEEFQPGDASEPATAPAVQVWLFDDCDYVAARSFNEALAWQEQLFPLDRAERSAELRPLDEHILATDDPHGPKQSLAQAVANQVTRGGQFPAALAHSLHCL
jgi:hypothetical protein